MTIAAAIAAATFAIALAGIAWRLLRSQAAIVVKIDQVEANTHAIAINQRETSEAVGRISVLEKALRNGLTERLDRIEANQDAHLQHHINGGT